MSLTVIICLFHAFKLPKQLAKTSLKLKNQCRTYIPKSNFQDIHSALICGDSIQSNDSRRVLSQTGLIHLIVVSGSHLTFLSTICALLLGMFIRNENYNSFITFIILFFFTVITGLEPPCTRALLNVCLQKLNHNLKLNWSNSNTVAISGICSLLIFPDWSVSLSFLLSWICALAISMNFQSEIKKSALIYIGLLPALSLFGAPHPLTILINLILTPIIGIFIFPLSIFSLIFQSMTLIFNKFWEITFVILKFLIPYIPKLSTLTIQQKWIWLLIVITHIFIHLYTVKKRQNV